MSALTDARIVTDADELAQFFSDAPAAHIYATCDLEEPFWSSSTWFRRGDAVVGLVGMPGVPVLAVYAVSTKDPAGTLALVTEIAARLRPGVLITGPVGLGDALRPHRELAWDRRHHRYELVDRTELPEVDERVVPLGPDDLDEVAALYASDPGAAFFLPPMLDDDTFVGVREAGELVAVAGTHVMSTRARLAAIGAVYTRPEHRGRGLGRAVTVGAIDRLGDRVDTIGLNVDSANTPARRIYESIGFEPALDYDEAELA